MKMEVRSLNNISSQDNMLEKLKSLNKPYIPYLVQEIIKNPNLGNKLWLAIGNKNFAYFSYILQKKDGTFVKGGSNRHTLNDIISDRLVSDFSNQDNVLLDPSEDSGINEKQAEDFFRFIKIAKEKLIKFQDFLILSIPFFISSRGVVSINSLYNLNSFSSIKESTYA